MVSEYICSMTDDEKKVMDVHQSPNGSLHWHVPKVLPTKNEHDSSDTHQKTVIGGGNHQQRVNIDPMFSRKLRYLKILNEESPLGEPGALFPANYKFRDNDVCSGRGKKHWKLPGNCKYRDIIRDRVHEYLAAKTRNEKTLFISNLVHHLRCQGYQFLKEDKEGRLFDMGNREAREKVAHCLRDQVTALRMRERLLKAQSSVTGQQSKQLSGLKHAVSLDPQLPRIRPVPSEPNGTLIDYWIELS